MTEEEYLKERIDDQIAWYGKKSAINKTYYYWSNGLVIVFAALIPFLAGFRTNDYDLPKYLIAAFGVLTATFTGLAALLKFQEKWTKYRITAEALRREKLLFKTATSPYNIGSASFNVFVRNMEGIMSNENVGWTQIINKKDDKPETEDKTSTKT